jgi:hypothetical protein
MELNNNQQTRQIKQSKLSDVGEKARILRTYAGIFPHNIKEFSNTVIKKMAKVKNYAK